ncbi:membrane protein [Photobacterium aquae]|uniref:Membrane protein n=1 Tax=Photobacterium aquae TaxID=1195763 RepID=A0A0J1JQS1_9GAMM|nr:hypothetical protein [Photobacterium aquae]KLV04607.1 membrane protein [Photobacterium aquae]
MSKEQVIVKGAAINWHCKGKFNFTSGFGATRSERMLANYGAIIAPVGLYFAVWQDLGWSVLQIIVASLLALDMVGGVITNSLGSMKRFLHTDQPLALNGFSKWVGSKFLFPAMHFQLFVVPLCFDTGWSFAFFWYGMMMVSLVCVHVLPMYLQRPVAMLVVMLSIMLAQCVSVPVGLEWLGPIFIIKLVLAHGVREEPYRPDLDS